MPKDLDLPKGCNRCRSAPHVFREGGGAERCTCARGRQLFDLDQARLGRVPKVARVSAPRRRRDPAKAAANDKEDLLS